MSNRAFTQVLATLFIWSLTTSASAVSITADQSGANIAIGTQITLVITGDFSDDPTLGGGLNFDWDPTILSLVSFGPFDWGGDPDFFGGGNVNAGAGTISSFASGNFDGVSGPVMMAMLTFEAIASGRTLFMSDDFGGPAGRFVSAINFGPQVIDFGPDNTGGLINVVVPLPAAGWLMMIGLGMLFGLRRKT